MGNETSCKLSKRNTKKKDNKKVVEAGFKKPYILSLKDPLYTLSIVFRTCRLPFLLLNLGLEKEKSFSDLFTRTRLVRVIHLDFRLSPFYQHDVPHIHTKIRHSTFFGPSENSLVIDHR